MKIDRISPPLGISSPVFEALFAAIATEEYLLDRLASSVALGDQNDILAVAADLAALRGREKLLLSENLN